MKVYILDTINKLQRFSEKLDVKTILCNKSWCVFNDSDEKEVYIFQEDGNLIISNSGKVTKGSWQYLSANKSIIINGNNQSYMPIKINTAGVVPVIFASSLLTIPAVIAQFTKNAGFIDFVNNYLTYTKPVGLLIFALLIYFFAYFYTFIQLRPEELAKNLKENGGFIPGVRPGKDTENYISKVLSRLTVFGALFLVVLAALPILFSAVTGLPQNVSIGGTSLLIVVGVALETYRQLEGSLVSRNYKRGYTGRRR